MTISTKPSAFELLKAPLRRLDSWMFSPFYNEYPNLLEAVIGSDCRSLLDVGCGTGSPIKLMKRRLPFLVGTDGYAAAIEASRLQGIHDEYVQCAFEQLPAHFAADSFDCVLASDVIEHLTKEDGLRLLDSVETIARSLVLVFTPNGFLPQEADDNPYQKHVSGWVCDEFRERGYDVIGVHGWKPLRTSYNAIRFKPHRLFERLSLLTSPLVRNRPEHAFQILAVKRFPV